MQDQALHTIDPLTVTDTVSGNTAGFGGGIYNAGALTLAGASISGNTSSGQSSRRNVGTSFFLRYLGILIR